LNTCILITYFDLDSLVEAKGLCESAQYQITHIIKQDFLQHTRFGLSEGRIEELKEIIKKTQADVVVFDEILKPSQNYNLASELKIKVVYASSSSVYGDTKKIPITEDFDRNPINPYGLTKLEDEYLAEKYSKAGTQIIGLRYFNVFGIGQSLDYAGVITKFLDKINVGKHPIIFGDGLQVRDFIFVRDVVKANLVAMLSNTKSGFFNVGTGNGTSIKDLASLMIKISGKSLETEYEILPAGDIKLSKADTSLSIATLDWRSQTTLEEGLQTLF